MNNGKGSLFCRRRTINHDRSAWLGSHFKITYSVGPMEHSGAASVYSGMG